MALAAIHQLLHDAPHRFPLVEHRIGALADGHLHSHLFRQLVGVSGVGAGTARMILSAIPAAELPGVIAGSDLRRLKGVKGVGAKTAERIIVDLRDKIKTGDATLIQQSPADSEVFEEALAALVMLGFTAQQSRKVLGKLFDSEPGLKVEVAIRKALPLM